MITGVLFSFGILGYFKYLNFALSTVNNLFGRIVINQTNILLPIGISFFTFQIVSYIIDLYNKKITVQKNFFDLLLYVSFFPQLIAGPIVKYRDIQEQITDRKTDYTKIAFGIKRFTYGLGKKVLIANPLGLISESIFSNIDAWNGTSLIFAAFMYTFQIYYDFSGYSDMAIGLGKIFGFDFLENFNYPYCSKSITEFWKRWHISLSTWFKEYLYIPLGGSREGNIKTYRNLMIVFLATGLWHGASWNFVIWGMFHGFFLVIERKFLSKYLSKIEGKLPMINRIYMISVVTCGWIMFNADNIRKPAKIFRNILIKSYAGQTSAIQLMTLQNTIIILVAILCCGIIQNFLPKLRKILYDEENLYLGEVIVLIVILLVSIIKIISSTYNPFIYFRF